MFFKSILGAMFIIAMTPIAPGLAALGFIVIPIIIVVLQNKEERAANEAKYGWDPVRDKFENLPKEQQDRVKQGWDDERTRKREEITQICRRQKAIPGTISQRLRGKTDFYPSLEDWHDYTHDLPQSLKNRLLAAAETESWELSKSKALITYDRNAYPQARQNLINVYNECEVYRKKGASVEAPRQNNTTSYVNNNQRTAALCTVNLVSRQDEWDDDW